MSSSNSEKKTKLFDQNLDYYIKSYVRFYQRENLGIDLKKLNTPGKISFDKFFEKFSENKNKCKSETIFPGSEFLIEDCLKYARNMQFLASPDQVTLNAANQLLQWAEDFFNPSLDTLDASGSSFEIIESLSNVLAEAIKLDDSFVLVDTAAETHSELPPAPANKVPGVEAVATHGALFPAIQIPSFPSLDVLLMSRLNGLLAPPKPMRPMSSENLKSLLDESAKYFEAIAKGGAPDDLAKASALLLAHAWRMEKTVENQKVLERFPHYADLNFLLNTEKINKNVR